MKIKKLLKNIVSYVPPSIGVSLAHIDYKYRLGKRYSFYKNDALNSVNESMLFQSIYSLVRSSEKNILFYREYYKKNNFTYTDLKSFKDLAMIPIVTKSDLQNYEFKERVLDINKGIVTNTGGTSGQPLKLLLDNNAHAREWAHMHTIWGKLGYKISSIKLTLRGMNLGTKPLNYNFIHNEFQVNAYCDFERVIESLDKVLNSYVIEYLHGYPSSIYEFIKQLGERNNIVLEKLKTNLKGVFFGSEYPAPIYRTYVEEVLKVPTISWYGHTEMAVLAYEKEQPFVYHPFQSYGFTEAVDIEGKQHLIGTTIHNKIGPLIRYDTGDIIEPLSYKNGLLDSFKVSEGRVGEFVTDKNGRNISLTALIFGRHHEIFSKADFIQVSQKTPGKLIVYVTSTDINLNCESLFDTEGIDMDVKFKILKKPFKTKAGKVLLLIKN